MLVVTTLALAVGLWLRGAGTSAPLALLAAGWMIAGVVWWAAPLLPLGWPAVWGTAAPADLLAVSAGALVATLGSLALRRELVTVSV